MSVDDGKHTVTYVYDGTDALGNQEHRGLITGMTVSGVGSFTAAYDAAGNMVVQSMPGGIAQEATYDLAGNATSLTYTGTDEDGEAVALIGWSQDSDLFGRVVHESTPSDAQGIDSMGEYTRTYTYDRAGRLVTVNDRSAAAGEGLNEDDPESTITPCVTRSYTFDARGNRLTRSAAVSGTSGACTTSGAATEAWSYDSADRVQTGANGTGSYVYDALGRRTTVPAIDTPSGMAAGNLQIGYYDDDLVRSLTQDGVTTTFTLDAMGRRYGASTVSSAGTSTLVRHYADATDNPAWAVSTVTDGVVSLEIADSVEMTQNNVLPPKPVEDVLAGLSIPALPEGSSPIGLLALVKYRESDGSTGWAVRVTSGLDEDEVLGILVGYVHHCTVEAAASWRDTEATGQGMFG